VEYRWRAAKTIDLIQIFDLYATMRDKGFSSHTIKYLLVIELRLDQILYSKLGNENSDSGHIK